ncbi:MAG: hypothetical protein ACRDLK_08665 [Gaiellaceae bacterium]
MKIRALLKWFNDALRPVHVEGEDGFEPPVDKTTALTTMHVTSPMGGLGAEAAPPGYVPSQQDEKPE